MKYNYKTKKREGYNTLELGIFYEIGGMNYFSGSLKPRCYYVGALACNVSQHDGYGIKEHMIFDDSETAKACQNIIIREVGRENKKLEKRLFDAIDWEKYGEAIEARDFDYLKSQIDILKNVK